MPTQLGAWCHTPLMQIKAVAIASAQRLLVALEDSMTLGEIAVLGSVLGAFVAFAVTLAWYSR